MVTYDINEVFQNYHKKVYRLALSITRNEKDAEDILQNTFVKVMQNIDKFQQRSHISTWIYRIAYNEALMLLRKRKRTLNLDQPIGEIAREMPAGWFVNWPEIPDSHLINDELKKRIDQGLKHLPIKYRMPLLLHRVEGIPLKETSEILGLKLNSLKTRLHRAGLLIKAEMEKYFSDRQEPAKSDPHPQCNLFMNVINDYVHEEMPKAEKRDFKEHIKDCKGCNVFLDSYQQALRMTNALQCEDIPADLVERLESFLRKKWAQASEN